MRNKRQSTFRCKACHGPVFSEHATLMRQEAIPGSEDQDGKPRYRKVTGTGLGTWHCERACKGATAKVKVERGQPKTQAEVEVVAATVRQAHEALA